MRVVAACVVFAIYVIGISIGCNEGNTIHLNLNGATGDTYTAFIETLRSQLTSETHPVTKIPLLNHGVPDSRRFILVVITNNNNQSATVAIDVVDVSVVGYCLGGFRSVFLRQVDPTVPVDTLFTGTYSRRTLHYTGSYADLDNGTPTREQIPLGPHFLHTTVSLLFNNHDNAIRQSFLVIIQMVSEAARFRYIETRIRRSFNEGVDFRPDRAMLSLENNWGSLSTEIQQATKGVVFQRTVQLRGIANNIINVDSVNSPAIAGLALLPFLCQNNETALNAAQSDEKLFHVPGTIIRMPVNNHIDEFDHDMNAVADTCLVRDRTTRISGRDGLCADLRDGRDNDGNPIQVLSCGHQINQQWTFGTDGTIRCMGKCMTTYGYSPGNYIMIYDCDTAAVDATKWALSIDGTITNPRSGLVLTATAAAQGTTLTVETNTHDPRQGWRAGDYVDPLVSFIMGHNDLCMEYSNNQTWLNTCVSGMQQQQWALYGDGTIRVNSDRSLCLSSYAPNPWAIIYIQNCQASDNQRWVFRADGSILNPATKLVMDGISAHRIMLNFPNGYSNQQWLPCF